MKDLYKIKEVIGRGAFSSVRLATHRESKKRVAIKVQHKNAMSKEDVIGVQNEIEYLSYIDHPNVV